LHAAAYEGHKELVELLLAHGDDVNARNDASATPLNMALGKGFKDVAQLLRQHGGRE
jgi:uncharacterized protein